MAGVRCSCLPRHVPHGIMLIGRLFEEGKLRRVGIALEQALLHPTSETALQCVGMVPE